MAYVNVPKDLTKVKSKVLFNLTKRQLICFGCGALIGVPLFFLLRKPIGVSPAAMLMMVVMLPAFMMGVYEKNGQPLEVILRNIICVSFLRPKVRPYINPMDLNLDYSDDENPLSLKSDFILSLCELIVGGKDGLAPVEKTIIDRCVRLVYRDYLNDPCPENMPVLEDLYNSLRQQEEKEAQYVATALEIYVTGSLNVFNHRTNVDVNNRIVCYDIKELGKQLKKIGMLIVQDRVWNRVTINRAEHKTTRYHLEADRGREPAGHPGGTAYPFTVCGLGRSGRRL